MRKDIIWRQVSDLTNRVLQITTGLELTCSSNWPAIVAIELVQANERLDSIHMLLEKGYRECSEILTRSLFELAANLYYIAKDDVKRLPKYLEHGGIPLSKVQRQQLQQKLNQQQPPPVKDLVPGKGWIPLKNMCCDLGAQWPREYETFYRYASVPSHAGSFTLGNKYVQLLKQQPLSGHEKATILITALEFHLRVTKIAANIFPEQIELHTVIVISEECQKLGNSLASS